MTNPMFEAIKKSVLEAIEEVGIEGLRKTSMFPSSSKKIIYNCFDKEYRLVVSFTDHAEAKKWLIENDLDGKVGWVGVWPDGSPPKSVPMWRPLDFVNDYPHES